jgi:uncharacterized protein YoaH (UPF0181 family)
MNVANDVEKLKPLCTVGMENGEAIMEDSLEAPQKFKNRIVR